MMTFRQATLDDLEEIQQLFVGTVMSTCRSDYDMEQLNAWVSKAGDKERWKNFIVDQYFIIAETDGKMAGYSSLKNGNYVNLMYVHKDFLRQGIAGRIYEKLKGESLRLGFHQLTSDVSKTAQPFFETKGFKVIRENKNVIDGIAIVNYHMS
ncbi:MAG: GNAT family N-acetyltransferase, partial [Bacteroidota bacterium]